MSESSDEKLWFDYQKTAAESRRLVEKLEDKIEVLKREFLDELRVIISENNSRLSNDEKALAELSNKVAVLDSKIASLTTVSSAIGLLFLTGIIGIAVDRIYRTTGNQSYYEKIEPGGEAGVNLSANGGLEYTNTRSR